MTIALRCHKFAESNDVKHARQEVGFVRVVSTVVSHKTHAIASQYAEYLPDAPDLYRLKLPDKPPIERHEYDDEIQYWH